MDWPYLTMSISVDERLALNQSHDIRIHMGYRKRRDTDNIAVKDMNSVNIRQRIKYNRANESAGYTEL
jgi:hypothetical protein